MSAPDKQMIERVARAIFLLRRNKVRVALGHDPLPDDIAIEERGVNWADAVEAAQAALSTITPPNGDEVREALERARSSLEQALEPRRGEVEQRACVNRTLGILDAALAKEKRGRTP